MKTDHPIYLYLRSGPEAFRVLSGGVELEGPYKACSLTIKDIERRLDGLVEPDGHAGPTFVLEFQAQPSAKSLYNLNSKIGLYGEQHPDREVLGILGLDIKVIKELRTKSERVVQRLADVALR
jgi:hypothetical protein